MSLKIGLNGQLHIKFILFLHLVPEHNTLEKKPLGAHLGHFSRKSLLCHELHPRQPRRASNQSCYGTLIKICRYGFGTIA